jgi:hypothetical protein
MSTRTDALGYERNALLRTWLAVCAIVIAACLAIAFALTRSEPSAAPAPARHAQPPLVNVVDYGPPSTTHGPILVNGVVCGQCR